MTEVKSAVSDYEKTTVVSVSKLSLGPSEQTAALVRHTNTPCVGLESIKALDRLTLARRGHQRQSVAEILSRSPTSALKYVKVDFNRLTGYQWQRYEDKSKNKVINAPDRMYIHTSTFDVHHEPDSASVYPPNTTISTPCFAVKKQKETTKANAEEKQIKPNVDISRILPRRCKMCSKGDTIKKNTENCHSNNNHSKSLMKKRMGFSAYERVGKLIPLSNTALILGPSNGLKNDEDEDDEGCLYNQVKHSINHLSHPRNKSAPVMILERPLKKEKGRYRPISRTTVKTPKARMENLNKKSTKSADAFLRHLKISREAKITSPTGLPGSRGSSATILQNTPSRWWDSRFVESVSEYNRPPEGDLIIRDWDEETNDPDKEPVPHWAKFLQEGNGLKISDFDSIVSGKDGDDNPHHHEKLSSGRKSRTLTIDVPSSYAEEF